MRRALASDSSKAAGTAAKIAGQHAAGAMVGGMAGNVIAGGYKGTAIGVLLSPQEISRKQGCPQAKPRHTPRLAG
jgi:hypothetical protein